MPLPKYGAAIACFTQFIGQRFLVSVQQGHSSNRIVNPRPHRVSPGEQERSTRRAKRRSVKIDKINALGRKPIDAGGSNVGMAMTAQLIETLVVGQDEEHIGSLGQQRGTPKEKDGHPNRTLHLDSENTVDAASAARQLLVVCRLWGDPFLELARESTEASGGPRPASKRGRTIPSLFQKPINK